MDNPTLETQQKAAELVARLQASFGLTDKVEGESNPSLRYVIYARKSTDTAEKQERSIGDQIGECKTLADRLGLRWVDVIHEEKSAMVADKREKFRTVLDDVRNGKYDGIISWAPDRLARNMKEGGEIIDMLDRGEIQDIKFGNHFSFTNNPSGKMLLGIAFVMAKQYSDQHSQNVTRAIRRKTAEGKWAGSHVKHGYYKDKQHFLRPDGGNHELIKEAFALRLKGAQLKDIGAFLKDKGFPLATKHTKHRELRFSETLISNLMRDPLYAGAMVFGDGIVNLFEKYDFVPAVDVADFERIRGNEGIRRDYKLTEVIRPRGEIKADLMRGMVVCGHCSRAMATGITSKELPSGPKHYFYYRCDTIDCKAKGKSVRAKLIMEAAYAFLNKYPLATGKGYKRYVTEMEKVLIEKGKETDGGIKRLTTQRQHEERRIEDMKELIQDAKGDKVLVKEYEIDLKKHLTKSKAITAQLKELTATKVDAKQAVLTFDEFHELFQNIANYIQKVDSMADLDYLMRKLFMNFTVTDKKVTNIKQNSPFAELLQKEKTPHDEKSSLVTPRRIELRLQA